MNKFILVEFNGGKFSDLVTAPSHAKIYAIMKDRYENIKQFIEDAVVSDKLEQYEANIISKTSSIYWQIYLVNDKPDLQNFYYTFGSSSLFPHQNGYVVVKATNWEEANKKFSEKYPSRDGVTLNCAFSYNEKQWAETPISKEDYACYGTIA